jgi:two-component system, NtrC family, response regulator GlrR
VQGEVHCDTVDGVAGTDTRLTHRLRFPRYRLEVVDGPDRGRSLEGAEELAVGLSDANDFVLTDPTVSRHHISIASTANGHLVRDLGSKNGTAINGVSVESAYLAPSAIITIGNTKLKFEPVGGEDTPVLSTENRWGRALGASAAMRRIFAMLPKLAASDATILIEGETGTGKTLLANAIHEASPRATKPFIVVDCGAIPPNLIESELFGHEKGSFTGAIAARTGAFEAASGGTVFLDEIGELPLDMQPKLLRSLEDHVVKRIGGNRDIKLDIRILAATNRDLRSEINRGRFRSDLYYRLNTFKLRVPPLRERRDDIPLLVADFYSQLAAAGDAPPAELIADFARHQWPGNVRELRAAVERTVLLGDPSVWRELADDYAPATESTAPVDAAQFVDSFRVAKERAVGEWERGYVRSLLAAHGGNVSRAARTVRMDRNHLRELLARHRVRSDEG